MSNQTKEDFDRFFDYDVHIPTRTLFMGGDTDEGMAERFIKGMHLLEAKNLDPITVIMNNYGGDEYDGMAIYDAIATSKCYTTIVAYGSAMSMGSWIPQAADERVMAPSATMMIHYGTWGGYELDSIHVATMHKENERLTHNMEQEYLRRIREKHPKFPLARLRRWLTNEKFLTAEETVEWGLADKVLA